MPKRGFRFIAELEAAPSDESGPDQERPSNVAPCHRQKVKFCASRDGTQLAFLWSRGVADQPGARVFVINADGSGPTNLTNNAGLPSELSWSPDGTRLAFSSDRDGQFDVYVINVDGAGLTNLSNDPADDFQQRWSPDGTRLAFSSDRDGDFDIYIMNADGTGLVNLTNGPADEFMPAWSPAP